MTVTIYSPDEYRQLGHQLASFYSHCRQLNRLFSAAYPHKHPIYQACCSAVEDGLFTFRCRLEILARQDHPTIDLHFAFHPNGQEGYHRPPSLPGCTDAETEQLAESIQRRRTVLVNREPLTVQELAIVVRCYHHINETIDTIQYRFKRFGMLDRLYPRASIPIKRIHNALVELQTEKLRVVYGQTR